MAVIKATDILAEVAKAKARVTSANVYFEVEHELMAKAKLQAQLEQTAQQLANYVRKLPAPVRNKHSKACSAALAYTDHILRVEIPSVWGK